MSAISLGTRGRLGGAVELGTLGRIDTGIPATERPLSGRVRLPLGLDYQLTSTTERWLALVRGTDHFLVASGTEGHTTVDGEDVELTVDGNTENLDVIGVDYVLTTVDGGVESS